MFSPKKALELIKSVFISQNMDSNAQIEIEYFSRSGVMAELLPEIADEGFYEVIIGDEVRFK